MGCDIHGYIETTNEHRGGKWDDSLNIRPIINRNYDMFGLLFGVRNSANFRPIAKARGPPTNISQGVRSDYLTDDDFFHSASYITLEEIERIDWAQTSGPNTAKDALSGDWEALFNIMRELGKVHGKKNVRLVVWFDI